MNIVIIDDNAFDCAAVRQTLEEQLQKYCISFQIHEFPSAEEFFSRFEPEYYDICFMDIYLDKLNGMDAARKLRELDPDCDIVFLTVSNEYVFEGYEVQALRYLIKPLNEKALQSILTVCMKKQKLHHRRLLLPIGKKTYEIPFQKILYAISSINSTEIHLQNTFYSLSARHTFSSIVEPLLEDYRFLTCSRGIVINLSHAKEIHKNYFIMTNGVHIPISRRLYSSVHDAYIDFQFEHLL